MTRQTHSSASALRAISRWIVRHSACWQMRHTTLTGSASCHSDHNLVALMQARWWVALRRACGGGSRRLRDLTLSTIPWRWRKRKKIGRPPPRILQRKVVSHSCFYFLVDFLGTCIRDHCIRTTIRNETAYGQTAGLQYSRRPSVRASSWGEETTMEETRLQSVKAAPCQGATHERERASRSRAALPHAPNASKTHLFLVVCT